MIHCITGFIRHEFLMARRYWLNTVSAAIFGYVIFVLLFFGVRTYAGPGVNFGTTVEGLIVGYWVVLLTNMTFQSIESFIGGEAIRGTLEQLYLSPFDFRWIAFGKMLGSVLQDLAINAGFLFLMMITTGRWLHLDILSILPLLFVLISQAYSLGFIMGGLILIYKRIGALSQATAMLLIIFITAPPDLSPLVRLLPFNITWRLLRNVMTEGTPLWMLPIGELTFITVKMVIFWGGGWAIYRWCENIAKRRGLLGQH